MTAPFYTDDTVTLWHGDCLDVMRGLPDNSIDAVVTDPPYGLGFMGKEWDSTFEPADMPMRRNGAQDAVNTGASRQGGRQRAGLDYQRRMARDSQQFQRWCQAWATEALRVLKPGGHMLAFGGTRTWHRLCCAVEDAGFEIRDSIAWLYGSGFPKSLDVSKAIDKAAGEDREREAPQQRLQPSSSIHPSGFGANGWAPQVREAVTDAARQWQGWGTALKPAYEPIVVARKPLTGTVAANIQQWETGALNIDATRIGSGEGVKRWETPRGGIWTTDSEATAELVDSGQGRWPANVILDDTTATELDKQAPATGNNGQRAFAAGEKFPGVYGDFETDERPGRPRDIGGASRFFYTSKADTSERPRLDGAGHPTVKPLDLMRWLVRLVTPPGGIVLDPFLGSGTTAEACIIEHFRCIGIERDDTYIRLARTRLAKPIEPVLGGL